MKWCVVVKIRFDCSSICGMMLKYGSVVMMCCVRCVCVRLILIVLCLLLVYGVGVMCVVDVYVLCVSGVWVSGCVLCIRYMIVLENRFWCVNCGLGFG